LPFLGKLFVEQIVLRAIRFAFKHWGWTNDLEAEKFCFNLTEAKELCASKKRWVIHPTPINGCLPEETCVYGESLAAHDNGRPKIKMYAVEKHDMYLLNAVRLEAQRLRERLEQRQL
jgi:hypothetical protein